MKLKIKKIIEKIIKIKFFKYGLAAFGSYLFLNLGMILAVEVFRFNESYSYLVVLFLSYFYNYTVFSKCVFKVNFSKNILARYIIFLAFFWVINNIFFNIFISIFKIKYLLAILINIIIFSFLKFFINDKFVFVNKSDYVKN